MTLYGLDVIIAKNGHFYLNEINGVSSGMKGFREIYGDNQVQEEVFRRLEERYGFITVNDGSYALDQYRSAHPLRFKIAVFKSRFKKYNPIRGVLASPKAFVDWMSEDALCSLDFGLPFPSYDGQKSTVFNLVNEVVPHPLINPYVNEAIAENKFLQYRLLKDTSLSAHIPKTALIGLGSTDEVALTDILDSTELLVRKPVLGLQGKGVKFMERRRVLGYSKTRGPIFPGPFFKDEPLYVEDLVAGDNYSFEPGLAIIQPFISSKRMIDAKKAYSVVRAIVCNGHFVDAYLRVSPHKRVNLSQGALAHPLSDKDRIGEFSERVIAIFERECRRYTENNFKSTLYNAYFEERGRTTKAMRDVDAGFAALRLIYPILDKFDGLLKNIKI
jgi:glutathione synthase/RimK-type ligase-like ATP-grasp enzyme